MKARIFVRDLSEEERQALIAGLRSSDVVALCRWTSGERHHDAVSGLVLRQTGEPGQNGVAADLGQCLLALQQESTHLASRAQPCLVKLTGKGVRILPLFLPKQSPWLNPIEPTWIHGKRCVVEPNGLLSAKQLAERICA